MSFDALEELARAHCSARLGLGLLRGEPSFCSLLFSQCLEASKKASSSSSSSRLCWCCFWLRRSFAGVGLARRSARQTFDLDKTRVASCVLRVPLLLLRLLLLYLGVCRPAKFVEKHLSRALGSSFALVMMVRIVCRRSRSMFLVTLLVALSFTLLTALGTFLLSLFLLGGSMEGLLDGGACLFPQVACIPLALRLGYSVLTGDNVLFVLLDFGLLLFPLNDEMGCLDRLRHECVSEIGPLVCQR